MNIIISPKAQFLSLEQQASEFRIMVQNPKFQNILTLAFAHFCQHQLPTTEQIQAVNEFIKLFLNFGEIEKEAPAPLIMKRLLPPESLAAMARESREKK